MMYIYGNIHIGKRFEKSSPCPRGYFLGKFRCLVQDFSRLMKILLQNLSNLFPWEFFHKWPHQIPPDVGVGFLRCRGCVLKQPQVSSPGIQLPEKFRSWVRSPATYPQKCPSVCRYIYIYVYLYFMHAYIVYIYIYQYSHK